MIGRSARVEQLMQASLDGRAARPGDRNPYAGDDYPLARAWRLGYQSMLVELTSRPPVVNLDVVD